MSFFFEGFYSACVSTFHLLYIVTLGIVTKKLKLVDNTFQKSLSKTVSNIVLPCFIFAQILRSFHISQYILIFQALIGCSVLFVVGYVIGYSSMKLLGYSENRCRFLGAVYSSPHTTSIPVILLAIIGTVLDKITPMPPNMMINSQKRGFLYIILNSIFSNIWRWSGGYYLIQPEQNELKPETEVHSRLLISTNRRTNNEMTISRFLKEIVNMPLIASCISLLITMIPPLQDFITKPNSIMYSCFINPNVLISKGYAFFVMMLLGLSLADSITFNISDEIKEKLIFKGFDVLWVCLAKLVLMPIITFPIFIYLFKYFLHADDVMLFLFLFMSSAPSAINMIVICTLKGAYMESISMLMVVMYAIAMITMTLSITFIIVVIAGLNNVII